MRALSPKEVNAIAGSISAEMVGLALMGTGLIGIMVGLFYMDSQATVFYAKEPISKLTPHDCPATASYCLVVYNPWHNYFYPEP